MQSNESQIWKAFYTFWRNYISDLTGKDLMSEYEWTPKLCWGSVPLHQTFNEGFTFNLSVMCIVYCNSRCSSFTTTYVSTTTFFLTDFQFQRTKMTQTAPHRDQRCLEVTIWLGRGQNWPQVEVREDRSASTSYVVILHCGSANTRFTWSITHYPPSSLITLLFISSTA